jgi:hypothetical protein
VDVGSKDIFIWGGWEVKALITYAESCECGCLCFGK